jgi:CDP-glycerol glycerophosphotransferase
LSQSNLAEAVVDAAARAADPAISSDGSRFDAASFSQLSERVAQTESFNHQVSVTIEQLVNAMLELRERRVPSLAAGAPESSSQVPTTELAALRAKVSELEQQLNYERTVADLTEVSRMHEKTRSVVFVGNTYFGDNLKYAFLECFRKAKERGFSCWFMPHTEEQERFVRGLSAPCFPQAWEQWTAEHVTTALSAAVVVTSDHLLHPNPFALPLFAGARHVQLWHGVSIKEIGLRSVGPLKNFSPHLARVLRTAGNYAAMVGTAQSGEAEWRRWFGFERYAPIGYPRNDVLYREPTAHDLLNVDQDAYRCAEAARANGQRVILWAPTFRDVNRVKWILEAGLPKIARELAKAGNCLIINLHPVEQPAVPELRKAFPQVSFVSARTDIYPLLSRCDVLVTDYSSVMFDWLHLQRPVVLYRPDHEDYTQRNRKLFDEKLRALPGPTVATAERLIATLCTAEPPSTPEHEAVRKELLGRWFDRHDGDSAERFVDLVVEEIERADPYFTT